MRVLHGALLGSILLTAVGLSGTAVRAQEGPCLGNDVCPPLPGTLYTIRAEDTLESIAVRYGLSADLLRRRNPQLQSQSITQGGAVIIFTADRLLVGQVIWLGAPVSGDAGAGDSPVPVVLPPSQRPIEERPALLDGGMEEPGPASATPSPAVDGPEVGGAGAADRLAPFLVVAAVIAAAGWFAYRRARH